MSDIKVSFVVFACFFSFQQKSFAFFPLIMWTGRSVNVWSDPLIYTFRLKSKLTDIDRKWKIDFWGPEPRLSHIFKQADALQQQKAILINGLLLAVSDNQQIYFLFLFLFPFFSLSLSLLWFRRLYRVHIFIGHNPLDRLSCMDVFPSI